MFLKYFFVIIIFFTSTIKACEKPSMPSDLEWNNWLKEVRIEAANKGISLNTIQNGGTLYKGASVDITNDIAKVLEKNFQEIKTGG